jgi:hypothetical protein
MRILSEKRASAISNGLFLISLGILVYTNLWWPGILLAIWITMSSKQYLTGRIYDAFITTFVLVGLFAATIINIDWAFLLPTLFIVAGIFIIYREYSGRHETLEEDKSEEIIEDVDLDSK